MRLKCVHKVNLQKIQYVNKSIQTFCMKVIIPQKLLKLSIY